MVGKTPRKFENWIGVAVVTVLVGFCYFATIGRTALNSFVVRYLVPREGCQWLQEDPFYTADFSGYTQTTFKQWIEEVYGASAENISEKFFDPDFANEHVFYWSVEGNQYRAIFPLDDAYGIRLIKQQQEIQGIDIEHCLGAPTYVQSYEGQAAAEALVTITELVYPEQGLLFRCSDYAWWFDAPETPNVAMSFDAVTRFAPTTEQSDFIYYLSRDHLLQQVWTPEEWASITLKPWEGWDNIEVTPQTAFNYKVQ